MNFLWIKSIFTLSRLAKHESRSWKILSCSFFTYQKQDRRTLKTYSFNLGPSKHFCAVRGQYNVLSAQNIEFFKRLLDSGGVILHPDELENYNNDWLKSYRGSSMIVLRPKTTDEVSKILSYCYEQNLAVCPQGGNTGLAGGSIPIFDEVIISTELMNKIKHFDNATGVLQCQAGCILESLENYANEQNFVVPLDLGAKGTCQIGGNIATNAGGLRFIRYGSLHGNVLGLEVVLSNGDVLNCMNSMRKNNTGYDLKHIFIGSEGTLAIITEVSLLCHTRNMETAVALLGCNSFEKVLSAAKIIKSKLSEVLSSLEMFDKAAADTVSENLKLSIPIADYNFYVLIEISGSNAFHNEEKLSDCLNLLMDEKVIADGTVATEPSKIKTIWSTRERITEALLREGCSYKYDVSLPLADFYKIVEVFRERLGPTVTRCVGYGHLGDGNMHFNATTRKFDPQVLDSIEPFIYEWVSERKGSISAEHGIGYKKKEYLHFNKSPNEIVMMRLLKQMLDPKGILNPYKVLL